MPSLDNAELNWNGSQGMDDFPTWPASVPSVAGLQISSGSFIADSAPEAFRGGLGSSWPSSNQLPADVREFPDEGDRPLSPSPALEFDPSTLDPEARQHAWSEIRFNSVESIEDYAGASPAFDVTTLSGLRGAGGWGFGSNANRPPSDFFDPLRRQPGLG